ncbi:MAG: GAF domain-containing protein, partial [Gammaproteobacteria bacterium]|nr:GAF domain-containing protein [Gammaproteobacteria bacterium]
RETVSDNPQQVKRLEQIEILMREWIDKITLPAIALRRQVSEGTKTMEEINAYMTGKAGKQYFDDFRRRIAAFEKVEKDRLAKRHKIAREAAGGSAANLDSMIETNRWVAHTHRVIARATEILASAVDMETGMRGYLLAGREEFLEPYADGEQHFFKLAAKLKKTVADNPDQVRLLGEIEDTLEGWKKNVTEPAIALRRRIGFSKTMDDMAGRIGEGRGKEYFDAFRKEITNFKAEEEGLMETRKQENSELADTANMVSIGGIILALFLGGIVGFLIVGNIARAFGKMHKVSEQLIAGNLDVGISAENTRDETGRLIAAMKEMADNFQMIIGETSKTFGQLAEGNMAVRITAEFPGDFAEIKQVANAMANDFQSIISETGKILGQFSKGDMEVRVTGKFSGDFGEIKNALQSTAEQLSEAKGKNDTETWLKTGQAQLGERISGEQKFIQLAENIINFITPYVGAQVGAFYLFEEAHEKNPACLKMIATHAYTWRKNIVNTFEVGRGVVGQAALERKTIIITQAPEDYIVVQTGLGESPPRTILVAPFLYEGALKGVVELASFKLFTEIQLEFLKQILPAIAIAMNTAESRTKMQTLLEQSQAQSEELQIQQEKMQHTNEELQSQTEELQSQQEELQSQQEELRQTNEELGSRTQDLEKEREGIRIKNRELEKTQQAIQTKAEELELASKYKSEFLANMSHELRTPLNSLLILAQLLAANKDKNLTEKQMECARTIHSSGVDLLALINEILDLSKVEAGKLEVQPEEVAFSGLKNSLQQKFRHVAEEKSLLFNVKIEKALPSRMFTDLQRLKQILNNLLSNAFKFTAKGSVTLDIGRPAADENLSRSGLDPAGSIRFSVSDSGIGIPREKQKLIFEAFQQADGTTSRRYGGTGLGLSISRQLAKLLDGEMQLHSEEGKGSRFTVYLPERFSQLPGSGEQQPQIGLTAGEEQTAGPNKADNEAIAAPEEGVSDDRTDLKPGEKSILIIE